MQYSYLRGIFLYTDDYWRFYNIWCLAISSAFIIWENPIERNRKVIKYCFAMNQKANFAILHPIMLSGGVTTLRLTIITEVMIYFNYQEEILYIVLTHSSHHISQLNLPINLEFLIIKFFIFL